MGKNQTKAAWLATKNHPPSSIQLPVVQDAPATHNIPIHGTAAGPAVGIHLDQTMI